MPERPLLVPASAIQRYFWRWKIAGWSNINVAVLWRLRGAVDRRSIMKAIDDLIRRHEALRTTLVWVDGEVQQCIRPFLPLPLNEVRLRSARSLDDAEAHEAIAGEIVAPFDVAARTLCRVNLFSVEATEDDYVLALITDHAIADAASLAVLFRELQASLDRGPDEGVDANPEVSVQFQDYAAWERRARGRHTEFWRPRVTPTGSRLPLAEDYDVAGPTIAIAESSPIIDQSIIRRLGVLAANRRATLATTIFGAIAAAFSPWAGDALRVGVVCSNRFDRPFQSVVGPLVNVLPLRIPLDPDVTFTELLTQTKREWLGALLRNVPLQAMYDLAGTQIPTSHRICDVSVNFLPYADGEPITVGAQRGAPLEIARHVLLHAPSRVRRTRCVQDGFPCGVTGAIDATGALHLTLAADPRILPRRTLTALAEYLARVIAALAQNSDDSVRRAVATCGVPLLPTQPTPRRDSM